MSTDWTNGCWQLEKTVHCFILLLQWNNVIFSILLCCCHTKWNATSLTTYFAALSDVVNSPPSLCFLATQSNILINEIVGRSEMKGKHSSAQSMQFPSSLSSEVSTLTRLFCVECYMTCVRFYTGEADIRAGNSVIVVLHLNCGGGKRAPLFSQSRVK